MIQNETEKCLWLIYNGVVVPRAGFEPATTRSSAERSPRLSYLGTGFHAFWMTSLHGECNHLRFLRNIKLSFTPTHSKPCSRYTAVSSCFEVT
jgi:hypothetical protein